MVKPSIGTGHQRDVMRGMRHLEPGRNLEAIVAEHLLGEVEVEHLLQEGRHAVDVLDGEKDVVDPGRGDPHEAQRARRRVREREKVAHLLHAMDELHLVARRRLEARHRAAAESDLETLHALHRDSGVLEPCGVVVEIL